MDFEWILTLVSCCVVTICFAVLAMKQIGSIRLSIIAFGLSIAVCAWSTMLAMQLGVIGLVAIITRVSTDNNQKHVWTLVLWSIVVPLFASVIPLLDREYSEARNVRRAYPMVSLASRLNYESTDSSPVTKIQLSTATNERLWRSMRWYRVHSLRRAHDLTYADFVRGAGFGRGRIPPLSKRAIDLPELPAIRYDITPRTQSFLPNGSAGESNQQFTPLPPESSLRQMHRDSLEDFFEPGRMGYVKDRQHVAGFTSHRFTRMPGTEQPSRGEMFRQPTSEEVLRPPRESWRLRWAIVKLELIGILRHSQPVAYVSDHLPQLDELSKYRVRDLTDFEESALAQMQSGENCVIDDQPDQILMVGSLRASEDCLQCHRVPQGTLLGALTYELRRE